MSSIPGELPRYVNVDGVSFKRLFAPGHNPVFLHSENIASGLQVLPGTVLGKITATGYLTTCVKTAADGSEVPYAIAHRYIDTTVNGPAGVVAVQPAAVVGHGTVYIQGLNIDTSWGATPDAAWTAISGALRTIGIFGVNQNHSY